MATGTKTQLGPIQIDNDALERETRDGFDPKERLKGRGLRKSTIVLFLDEELGPEIGDARDAYNGNGGFIGRIREGIIGEIDALEEEKAVALDKMRGKTIREAGLKFVSEHGSDSSAEFDPDEVEHPKYDTDQFDKEIAVLSEKRDEMIAELTRTGLTFSLRAVPPIIQRDCKRLAKATLKDEGIWEGKGLPVPGSEEREAYDDAHTAHLMTKLIQSVTDNETGNVNTVTTYEDAVDYMNELPPSQFARLDLEMGKLQIKDAISRSIESQVDFS